MKKALLFSLVCIGFHQIASAGTPRAPRDEDFECRSILEAVPDSTSESGKQNVYKGPYFRKNERHIGMVDEFSGGKAFLVRGNVADGQLIPNLKTLILIRTGVAITWNTKKTIELEYDNFHEWDGTYQIKLDGGIEFKRIKIFCGQNSSDIDAHIKRAYPDSRVNILPFSSGPWMASMSGAETQLPE
ncbi:MAG: hypothetical protein NDJ90_00220 [Oligoflexia bacterium]|nr:hypothetical protein [Oligoflexia bacterium]